MGGMRAVNGLPATRAWSVVAVSVAAYRFCDRAEQGRQILVRPRFLQFYLSSSSLQARYNSYIRELKKGDSTASVITALAKVRFPSKDSAQSSGHRCLHPSNVWRELMKSEVGLAGRRPSPSANFPEFGERLRHTGPLLDRALSTHDVREVASIPESAGYG
jgi:hypothetical protein